MSAATNIVPAKWQPFCSGLGVLMALCWERVRTTWKWTWCKGRYARSFRYQWFRVSTHQANATKHGKKSTLNLWNVINRKKCKRFLNSKPIMRRNYIHTFIYERSYLACQTFQISNFTSIYTQLTSQNAHTSSYNATYHDKDTIYN